MNERFLFDILAPELKNIQKPGVDFTLDRCNNAEKECT